MLTIERTLRKCSWYFPDAYLPDTSDCISHEAVCILNTSNDDAHIRITLYFEDETPISGFTSICPAQRTRHIRMDKILSDSGESVPQCKPYALEVLSDIPILCQYTRVDGNMPAHALMTTMGI